MQNDSESLMSPGRQSSADLDPGSPSTPGAAPAAVSDNAPRPLFSEDWSATLVGLALLGAAIAVMLDAASSVAETKLGVHPWKKWIGTTGKWSQNPLDAFTGKRDALIVTMGMCWASFAVGAMLCGRSLGKFVVAFPAVYLLSVVAFVLAGQQTISNLNLSWALWAIVVGLVVSNTIGVPHWLRPAVATELYIKTGLVVLGGEVLLQELIALGIPGICVAWIVTPIVLITTYWFGQRVLKMESKSLNMVICADMSVCGVSAAIAAAASCKAKKEELSIAVSMSLLFTVVMMFVMPIVIQFMGLDPIVGGAWIGGTIDSTGAVTAAGLVLGEQAKTTAATVKMIQNVLIGFASLGIAIYWVTCVERNGTQSDTPATVSSTPGVGEIWRRFPRFVIGFVIASLGYTVIAQFWDQGYELVDLTNKGVIKTIRSSFFCLAFVSIGLDTRFSQLLPQISSGKPVVLYLCGQALNIVLTFLMAYLMFGILFKDYVQQMLSH